MLPGALGQSPQPLGTGHWGLAIGDTANLLGRVCLRADVELTTTRSISASPDRGSEASRRAARKSGSQA